MTVEKALSIWQPWAHLIASGRKHIETRSWPTRHRGPLAIHAARKSAQDGIDLILQSDAFGQLGRGRQHLILEDLTSTLYPLGAIIATCTVTHCLKVGEMEVQRFQDAEPRPVVYGTTTPDDPEILFQSLPQPGEVEYVLGDYTPGRYAWILDDVRILNRPVACRGSQGLWDVPAQTRLDLAAAL